MPWLDLLAWATVLGVTLTLVLLGPRIWHSPSTRRARRLGGLGVIDEIYRPATYEQRIAEQRSAEAGDSVENAEPDDPSPRGS
jgi:hypothetical protein